MAGPRWAQKSDRSSHVQVAILAEQLCRERPGRGVRAGIEVVEGLRRGCLEGIRAIDGDERAADANTDIGRHTRIACADAARLVSKWCALVSVAQFRLEAGSLLLVEAVDQFGPAGWQRLAHHAIVLRAQEPPKAARGGGSGAVSGTHRFIHQVCLYPCSENAAIPHCSNQARAD